MKKFTVQEIALGSALAGFILSLLDSIAIRSEVRRAAPRRHSILDEMHETAKQAARRAIRESGIERALVMQAADIVELQAWRDAHEDGLAKLTQDVSRETSSVAQGKCNWCILKHETECDCVSRCILTRGHEGLHKYVSNNLVFFEE